MFGMLWLSACQSIPENSKMLLFGQTIGVTYSQEMILSKCWEGQLGDLPFALGDGFFYAYRQMGIDALASENIFHDEAAYLFYQADTWQIYADGETLIRKIVLTQGSCWEFQLKRTTRTEVERILPSDRQDDTVVYEVTGNVRLTLRYSGDILTQIELETMSNKLRFPFQIGSDIVAIEGKWINHDLEQYSFLFDYKEPDAPEEIRKRLNKEPLRAETGLIQYDNFQVRFDSYWWDPMEPGPPKFTFRRLDLYEGEEMWGITVGESTVEDVLGMLGSPDFIRQAWPYEFDFDGEIYAQGRKDEFIFLYIFEMGEETRLTIQVYFSKGNVHVFSVAGF
jgi:hypothetical protein